MFLAWSYVFREKQRRSFMKFVQNELLDGLSVVTSQQCTDSCLNIVGESKVADGRLSRCFSKVFLLEQVGKHRHMRRPLGCDPTIFSEVTIFLGALRPRRRD